jgi:1,4-dihydroxy-2-naphthoyl-CoA hydrolase
MPFTYSRTIHFADTDAAGVVYFANFLSICHEAYEASLAAAGINLKAFFRVGAVIFPIVHAEIDYLQPVGCGDRLHIHIQPTRLSNHKFQLHYTLFTDASNAPVNGQENLPDPLARATTVHLCIESTTRNRTNLPQEIEHWLTFLQIQPDA